MAIPTLDDVVNEARGLLQDTNSSTGYRYSTADLFMYGNDAIAVMASRRPELFTTAVTFTCVAGAEQSLPSAASLGITDVISNDLGSNVRPMDKDMMDRFRPGWQNDPAASALNWARQKGSNFTFYVHPPAANGMNLRIQHIALPNYTTGVPLDGRLVPYTPAIASYIAAAAESREQEGTGPQRKQDFMADFIGKISVSK